MSQNASSPSSGGIGFFGLLAILFIGLKLTNNIDWSWWWVLSPLWIPALICVSILVVTGLASLAILFIDRRRDPGRHIRRRR